MNQLYKFLYIDTRDKKQKTAKGAKDTAEEALKICQNLIRPYKEEWKPPIEIVENVFNLDQNLPNYKMDTTQSTFSSLAITKLIDMI